MTDITELARSLKAAADREMICRDVAETSEIWERTVTPENILALVEAMEKAQSKADVYDMLRDDYGLREKGVGLADFVDWQAKRIAELEPRTVTVGSLQESAYRVGLTAGWNLGLANNNDGFNKCLAAHAVGIKVEQLS